MPIQLLETKWGVIKIYNVAKTIGPIEAFCKLGTTTNALCRKLQHCANLEQTKGLSFIFIHC